MTRRCEKWIDKALGMFVFRPQLLKRLRAPPAKSTPYRCYNSDDADAHDQPFHDADR